MANPIADSKPTLRAVIGESVRMTRLRRRLSQEDVAQMAGTQAKQIVALERTGNVRLETAERIVNALGLSITISEAA